MGLLGLLIWLLPSASTPDPQESSEALWDASGTEVSIDGEELLIMKESDIMGVIEATKKAKKAA